jgi:hypothetical protein
MAVDPPQSQLVRLVMPDASEDEIAEASRRWFGFLQTLHHIVCDLEQRERDSLESETSDRFGNNAPHQ